MPGGVRFEPSGNCLKEIKDRSLLVFLGFRVVKAWLILGKLLGLRTRLSFQTWYLDENSSDNKSAEQAFEEYERIMADHNQHWQQLRQK